MESLAHKLAQWIKTALRTDMANGYTVMAPSQATDGTITMRVKDARAAKMLTITVKEDED